MAVLIFSESYDVSTDPVVEYLNQMKVPFVRINTNLNRDNIFSVSIHNDSITIEFSLNGKNYSIDDFDLIWARRGFFYFEKPNLSNKLKYNELENIFQSHIDEEINCLTDFLTYYIKNSNILCIGNPSVKNMNKLIVLQKAIQYGLNVPKTQIAKETSILANVFSENEELVSKPISERLSYYIPKNDTKPSLTTAHQNMLTNMNELQSSEFYYSLFQKAIDIKFELRVFFILDEYFACAIFMKEDVRNMMPYQLPEEILSKLKLLMKDLDLNTGSIDLLIDAELNYHFLEVNPYGQIEWIARECFPSLHYNIASIIKSNYEKAKNNRIY